MTGARTRLRRNLQTLAPTGELNSSAREFMGSGAPWVRYLNEVVLRQPGQTGIAIDENYTINSAGKSVRQLIRLFKDDGWSWPRAWYRRNRNRAHRGGIHLEKEIEPGRWLHLIVVPQKHTQLRAGSGKSNLDLPAFRIDLHAENHWLQPSSLRHFHDFVKERCMLPLLGLLRLAA